MKWEQVLLKVLLPLVVLAVGAGFAKVLVDSKETPEPAPPEIVLPTVRCLPAHRREFQVQVPTQGTVIPRTESRLVVEVAGRVTQIAADLVSGGFFEKGDLLLEIDKRDYELALRQSELEVARSKRRLVEEEADAAVARQEWEELGDGEGTPLALHEPQVAEAKAALAAAEAALERARRDIERTRVVAPFRGRVRTKLADLGQFLPMGSPVATVYAVDFAEVRLPLPDEELAFLELPGSTLHSANGSPAMQEPIVRLFASFAGAQREWSGRIVRTEGEIDPSTRMVMAVARLEDPYGRLAEVAGAALPVGLFVQAEIHGALLENVFVFPRSAIRDGEVLYTLDEKDQLHHVAIDIVRSEREVVVVRGDLEEGVRVIVSPLEIATESMQVRDLANDLGSE